MSKYIRRRLGRIGSIFTVVLVLFLLAALSFRSVVVAAENDEAQLVPTRIDPPAPPGSILPALATEGATTFNRENDVLLTWLEAGATGGRLVFSRYSGSSWSPPVTIAEDVQQLDPTDDASLTVIETQGPRRTLIARTGDASFRSPDAGRAWTALEGPRLPFSSFAAAEEGAYVFWLAGAGEGRAKLVGTRVLSGETVLDPDVAPRTVTTSVTTWDGPIVVYRDAGVGGGGRLGIVRRQDARWTEPAIIAGSEGQPTGIGENGPRVAASQRNLVVAWVAEGPAGSHLRLAFSTDAGRTFGKPIEVDGAEDDFQPSGPLAVSVDDDGSAVLLWTARSKAEAQVRLARVARDGRRGDALALARLPSLHLRGRVQLVRAKDRLAATWVEGVLARIRVADIPVGALPPLRERPATPKPAAGAALPYTGRGQVGDSAPTFALDALGGEKVSLEQLRGRSVLLNLWATWCTPCIGEMPELAALASRYAAQGLIVVSVNVDAENRLETVKKFVAERKLPFAVWLDPAMHIPHALRVPALPATFVIDRNGTIRLRLERPITAEDRELIPTLERALSAR